jgi:hypothetical protein
MKRMHIEGHTITEEEVCPLLTAVQIELLDNPDIGVEEYVKWQKVRYKIQDFFNLKMAEDHRSFKHEN